MLQKKERKREELEQVTESALIQFNLVSERLRAMKKSNREGEQESESDNKKRKEKKKK